MEGYRKREGACEGKKSWRGEALALLETHVMMVFKGQGRSWHGRGV